jgi:hypothetical protein
VAELALKVFRMITCSGIFGLYPFGEDGHFCLRRPRYVKATAMASLKKVSQSVS